MFTKALARSGRQSQPNVLAMPTLLLSSRQAADDAQKLWSACVVEKWDIVRVRASNFPKLRVAPFSAVPPIFLPPIFLPLRSGFAFLCVLSRPKSAKT